MGDPFDPDATCEDLQPGVYTFEGLFMHLYELDKRDDDELTARLQYPTVSVPITCQNPWDCSGESKWKPNKPSAGTQYATAQIRVTIDMGR